MNQHISAGAAAPVFVSSRNPQEDPSSTGVLIKDFDRITIACITGVIDSRSAGQVYDALVQCVIEGRTELTELVVDMSGVIRITRAGARGLIVAARLMEEGHGAMRICRARRSVVAALCSFGFNHLLKFDPTLEQSIAALAEDQPRTRRSKTVSTPNTGYGQLPEMVAKRRSVG
jgi:anti-anti-sigma regulatory factor